MQCPKCSNDMIEAKATAFGATYWYCRTDKKELSEIEKEMPKAADGIKSGAALANEGLWDLSKGLWCWDGYEGPVASAHVMLSEAGICQPSSPGGHEHRRVSASSAFPHCQCSQVRIRPTPTKKPKNFWATSYDVDASPLPHNMTCTLDTVGEYHYFQFGFGSTPRIGPRIVCNCGAYYA